MTRIERYLDGEIGIGKLSPSEYAELVKLKKDWGGLIVRRASLQEWLKFYAHEGWNSPIVEDQSSLTGKTVANESATDGRTTKATESDPAKDGGQEEHNE